MSTEWVSLGLGFADCLFVTGGFDVFGILVARVHVIVSPSHLEFTRVARQSKQILQNFHENNHDIEIYRENEKQWH